MTGPQPAGRPWAAGEDEQLLEMLASKSRVIIIARKLKRSPGGVYARARFFVNEGVALGVYRKPPSRRPLRAAPKPETAQHSSPWGK